MLDNVIQEIDVATGRLLFEWHSVGNVALRESHDRRVPGEMFDYFHANSVEVGPGGDLLVSARNTCAVYEIDRSTGRIVWVLGGKHSTLHMGPGTRFRWQHDARAHPGDVISVFDNHAVKPTRRAVTSAPCHHTKERPWLSRASDR